MILEREFKSDISREIFRVQSSIDSAIGNFKTSKIERRGLREVAFGLIDLEDKLSTATEITLNSAIASLNKIINRSDLKISVSANKNSKVQVEEFKLTRKELEVLALLPAGYSIKEMAKNLYLTESTVKSHLTSIYRKLSVTNRVQAIAKARENKVLTF